MPIITILGIDQKRPEPLRLQGRSRSAFISCILLKIWVDNKPGEIVPLHDTILNTTPDHRRVWGRNNAPESAGPGVRGEPDSDKTEKFDSGPGHPHRAGIMSTSAKTLQALKISQSDFLGIEKSRGNTLERG